MVSHGFCFDYFYGEIDTRARIFVSTSRHAYVVLERVMFTGVTSCTGSIHQPCSGLTPCRRVLIVLFGLRIEPSLLEEHSE